MANLRVMKALEYIHRKDLNNAEWNIEVDTFRSRRHYGTYIDINLPPHIAIWTEVKDQPKDLINNNPDYLLITADGKQAIYIWTI